MVQDQLVDYINAQLKLGTSREVVKTTLVGVGWVAADIDDSFKKVDGAATASARPIGSTVSPASSTSPSMPASAKPVSPGSSSSSGSGPQVIRMSDLVSSSDGPLEKMSAPGMVTAGGASAAKLAAITKNAKMTDTTFEAAPGVGSMPHASKSGRMFTIVLVALIVLLAAATGYLYFQNNSLSSRIGSVNGQSASVASQVASLTAQVNALTASSTALATSMSGLTSANQELMTELSFYAAPLGVAPTSTPVSVTGSLGVNASKNYFVIASYGGKIFVANSKDSKVITALQPLVGSSTLLSGTFVPGSDTMTVIFVNGAAL